jgi:MATE family multidrug resistance protein
VEVADANLLPAQVQALESRRVHALLDARKIEGVLSEEFTPTAHRLEEKLVIRDGLHPLGTREFGVGGPQQIEEIEVHLVRIGRMGPVAHIASNIALSINLIAFMPMIGMGMAAAVLVGQYLGRNEPKNAERMGWIALKIGGCYIAVIGLSFLLFPGVYTNVFEGDHAGSVPFGELVKTVRILLMMLAVWGVADAASIILSGALKGAGDTHFVMYFQSAVAWGFLVLGQMILVFVFKCGIYMSWAWTLLYIIILGSGFALRFRSGRWKSIDLLDRRASVALDSIPVEH